MSKKEEIFHSPFGKKESRRRKMEKDDDGSASNNSSPGKIEST